MKLADEYLKNQKYQEALKEYLSIWEHFRKSLSSKEKLMIFFRIIVCYLILKDFQALRDFVVGEINSFSEQERKFLSENLLKIFKNTRDEEAEAILRWIQGVFHSSLYPSVSHVTNSIPTTDIPNSNSVLDEHVDSAHSLQDLIFDPEIWSEVYSYTIFSSIGTGFLHVLRKAYVNSGLLNKIKELILKEKSFSMVNHIVSLEDITESKIQSILNTISDYTDNTLQLKVLDKEKIVLEDKINPSDSFPEVTFPYYSIDILLLLSVLSDFVKDLSISYRNNNTMIYTIFLKEANGNGVFQGEDFKETKEGN